ncbi:MAG: Sua5/YciO/YrdC/YwlC family protein, partial [Lachnospiraceae bacterium]|nr:Sua5/YciO/YrdC/YwlC family protein [Lachnospiraceae bacterium]
MKKDGDGKKNYITRHIRVYGIVQGVGFRPFVSRIADRIGVRGSVANKGSYVEIFAAGTQEQQEAFLHVLEHEAPERSAILKIDAADCADRDFDSFDIIESERETGDIFVSPDIATCPKCRQELFDPANRRYMHPFINCTACGPRLTILDAMPYDRERTSMKEFPMCLACEYEYTHAETRRYDAQPVCCNDCGPEVYLTGSSIRGRETITAARRAIADGKIVAIKGIGGFHLCCDATNEAAVSRLRQLKHRPAKPFAVMMKNLSAVHRQCEVSEREEEVLDGHAKPIILLKKKPGNHLAPSVAPDNPNVGVMLPYAPVQMLLFTYNDGFEMPTDSFVMTSGNVSGAPICRTDEDALREIGVFCDLILSHNRKIRLRADDSVMGFYEGEPYMIRRSRGYAPLPVMMDFSADEVRLDDTCKSWKGQVLAVGGELKNTFCIG